MYFLILAIFQLGAFLAPVRNLARVIVMVAIWDCGGGYLVMTGGKQSQP
jgi:multisubunit Na+/H+ antiporter MnhC subunit